MKISTMAFLLHWKEEVDERAAETFATSNRAQTVKPGISKNDAMQALKHWSSVILRSDPVQLVIQLFHRPITAKQAR
jgi:hypothetical protein